MALPPLLARLVHRAYLPSCVRVGAAELPRLVRTASDARRRRVCSDRRRVWPVAVTRSAASACAGVCAHPNVEATPTWLRAMQRLCQTHHVPVKVYVAPVGAADPVFVRFWEP